MRLRELEAQLYRFGDRIPSGYALHRVGELVDAQAVKFMCPKCFEANEGAEGTHSILVSFEGRGVPADADYNPRWAVSGTSLDDLALHPSVLLRSGCGWHGWVKNGDAS